MFLIELHIVCSIIGYPDWTDPDIFLQLGNFLSKVKAFKTLLMSIWKMLLKIFWGYAICKNKQ